MINFCLDLDHPDPDPFKKVGLLKCPCISIPIVDRDLILFCVDSPLEINMRYIQRQISPTKGSGSNRDQTVVRSGSTFEIFDILTKMSCDT